MIEFSEEEITRFEESIQNIYVEKSITVSNPNQQLFSASQKMGMSIDIPQGLTAEQTYKYASGQCSYYLDRWKNKLLGVKK